MKTPPLLPEETLHRVLRVANVDGFSVLAVAGVLALASASSGDWTGTGIGLLVAAAGAIELHGVGLLRAGEPRGMNWLIASQPYLLTMILGYCAVCVWAYDPVQCRSAMAAVSRIFGYAPGKFEEMLHTVATQGGKTEDQLLKEIYVKGYLLVAVVTLIYQGRMSFFYYQRRAAVTAAIEGPVEPPELT